MKIRDDASADEVRKFYESDLPRRVRARLEGNRRIDKAVEFMSARIDEDAQVLDIGCGIGIATEQLAKKASAGHVLAVDISPAHIDYCRRTIERDNTTFETCDVIADFDGLQAHLDSGVDVITMVDVIEHLPRQEARSLFGKFSEILNENGRILMTYPSPVYQKHLYETPGSRIQAIDLIVEHDDILELAARAECQIRHFSHVDVWRRNQYIHCELARQLSCERFDLWQEWTDSSLGDRAELCAEYLRNKARKVLRPLRRRKYVISGNDRDESQ